MTVRICSAAGCTQSVAGRRLAAGSAGGYRRLPAISPTLQLMRTLWVQSFTRRKV